MNGPSRPRGVVVVPCYDEAERLTDDVRSDFAALAGEIGGVLFVDDGSQDGTASLLAATADRSDDVEVLTLGRNMGKAEAVRRGLLHAIAGGADQVGYLDADLATPTSEYARLSRLQRDLGVDVVLGARVGLAGRRIDRRSSRHYLGRLYATVAGLVLGSEIYDTQCGAKVFRSDPSLASVLDEPFADRWAFDVELLGRVLRETQLTIHEEPLQNWAEVAGSKLGLLESLRATASLLLLRRRLGRRSEVRATNPVAR